MGRGNSRERGGIATKRQARRTSYVRVMAAGGRCLVGTARAGRRATRSSGTSTTTSLTRCDAPPRVYTGKSEFETRMPQPVWTVTCTLNPKPEPETRTRNPNPKPEPETRTRNLNPKPESETQTQTRTRKPLTYRSHNPPFPTAAAPRTVETSRTAKLSDMHNCHKQDCQKFSHMCSCRTHDCTNMPRAV
jgi:hypothetical protein